MRDVKRLDAQRWLTIGKKLRKSVERVSSPRRLPHALADRRERLQVGCRYATADALVEFGGRSSKIGAWHTP